MPSRRSRQPVPNLAWLALAVSAVACGGGGGGTATSSGQFTTRDIARTSTLEAIQKRGELRVGLEAGYFPFEMKDKQGNFVGFDVEVAQKMAEALGVKLTIINTDWDGIIPSLLADKFDIIMSGMTRTSKRALAINFSVPYFETGQVLLVNREKGGAIETYRDLDTPDKVIAVKQGTTGDFAATRLLGNATIRKYQTETDAAMEVSFGRADAFVYDEPFIRIWEKRNADKVRSILPPFTTEQLAWGVRKGDPDFQAWLAIFLDEIRHDDPAESTYDRLFKKYFVDMSWQGAVEE